MKVLIAPLKDCPYADGGDSCDEREQWCSSSIGAGTYCSGDDEHYVDLTEATTEERDG